jgi:hypothetical protein
VGDPELACCVVAVTLVASTQDTVLSPAAVIFHPEAMVATWVLPIASKFCVYDVVVRETCAWAEGARVSADPAARRSAMGRRIVVVVWEKIIGVHLGAKP